MTKAIKVIWVSLVKPIALYAILWAGFRYWLDFGNAQSIVFALLFGSCYFGFKELDRKTEKAEDFVPFRVSIRIHNPRDFFFRYKLVSREEDWKHICEKVGDTSILRRGFNFTVLSLSKEGLPHLTWLDDYKVFRAGMPSFEEVIQGLEVPSELSLDRKWSPSLYFGFRHGKSLGYKLALCVRDDWWEKNKIENVEAQKEYHIGSVYIICGTLPSGELGLDYQARHQDRKTELEKQGWIIKDIHDAEFSGWDTIEVRNEYFSISQTFLETD